MLIFHEGLPGSGKSFEACIKHIIPALQKGRKVFAYIEGINHEKFAEVCELPLEEVQRLLIQVDESEVKRIDSRVENDSLVVIDELQNFWPSGRQKLDDNITKFVTEHRHRGLDILCMGQDLRDCHALWKRRVSQKVLFTKLDALGMDKRYSWKLFKAISGEKFEKISSGSGTYDPRYFGLYASHTSDTTNFSNYKDDRANLFKTKGFKYALPVFFVVVVVAIKYLTSFFSEPSFAVQKTASLQVIEPQITPVRQSLPVVMSAAPVLSPEPMSYVEEIAAKYNVRLSGVVDIVGGPSFAIVEFLDDSYRVKEVFRSSELVALGWNVKRTGYGLELSMGSKRIVVRQWPVEPFGAMPVSVSHSPEISG